MTYVADYSYPYIKSTVYTRVSKQKSQRAPSIGAKNSLMQNVWKILRPKGPVGPAGPVMDITGIYSSCTVLILYSKLNVCSTERVQYVNV